MKLKPLFKETWEIIKSNPIVWVFAVMYFYSLSWSYKRTDQLSIMCVRSLFLFLGLIFIFVSQIGLIQLVKNHKDDKKTTFLEVWEILKNKWKRIAILQLFLIPIYVFLRSCMLLRTVIEEPIMVYVDSKMWIFVLLIIFFSEFAVRNIIILNENTYQSFKLGIKLSFVQNKNIIKIGSLFYFIRLIIMYFVIYLVFIWSMSPTPNWILLQSYRLDSTVAGITKFFYIILYPFESIMFTLVYLKALEIWPELLESQNDPTMP